MIRRQTSEDQFLLISQIEHARVAREIAEIWASTELQDYRYFEELLFAIEHHDDGWSDWEQRPDLEPQQQLPRSFMEMEAAEAIRISRNNVQACQSRHLACGFWASQHFVYLAQQRVSAGDVSHSDTLLIKDFLSEQERYQHQVLLELSDVAAGDLPGPGTAWLRFFDHVSLFLCCRCPSQPDHIVTPDKVNVTIHQKQTADGKVVASFDTGLSRDVTLLLNAQLFNRSDALNWPQVQLPERRLTLQLTSERQL